MNAYAQCRVSNEVMGDSSVAITYYPPNSNSCIKFQTETDEHWHHHDEHIHFRRDKEIIEVLIVNAMEEHQNLTIVCLPNNTLSLTPQVCMVEDSVLFVNSPKKSKKCKCIHKVMHELYYFCYYI